MPLSIHIPGPWTSAKGGTLKLMKLLARALPEGFIVVTQNKTITNEYNG